MMKCKKIFLMTAAALACGFIWAQSEEVEEISLPDVSTVISGGAPKVGKSAISDFTDVLPSADAKIENVMPKLPESSEAGSINSDSVVTVAPEKTIYVEGLAGGGFPSLITGNFKIYRQTGYSPFKVEFGHDSANGYAGKSVTSGYSDRDTYIAADKLFKTKKTKLSMNGKFESIDNGLQNQFDNISNVTQEFLGGAVNFDWTIPNGFALNVVLDGDWYNRHATVTGTPVSPIEDYAKNVSVLSLSPALKFSWGTKGFYSSIGAAYTLESDVKDSFYGTENANRGDFSVNVGWKNDVVHVYGKAAAVVGNLIGDNDVVVPFTCGVDFGFSSSISSRKILMSLSGGIDSVMPEVSQIEKQYKFSALSALPNETSDWYGRALMSLPIKDRFTLNVDGEFRTTAYGNGNCHPVYEASAFAFGQYGYEVEDMTQFNTDVNFSARIGIANFSAGWKVYWVDVPAAEDADTVDFSVSLQDKDGRVGFDGCFAMAIDSGADHVPVIDLSVFWRLTNAVRLAISTNDVVKLVIGEERDYAGEYISRGGSVTALVKFFF